MEISLETYRENFIKIAQILMAEIGIDVYKDFAEYLGIPYQTFAKTMARGQYPPIEHAQMLCLKGGFNANFLLLNKGPIKLQELTNMAEIKRLMKRIEEKI